MMRVEYYCGVAVMVLLFTSAVAVKKKETLLGGWTPIKDINDPHVTEIANFAVTFHNKLSGTSLTFQKVLSGDTQVVAGTNYRLTLSASVSGVSNKYQTLVLEKPWLRFKKLISFTPIAIN